ncbi:unnamed protein product [Ectocarpus sp. 12 AP-2014]
MIFLFTPPTPANPTQTRDGAIRRPRFVSEGSGGGALDVSHNLRLLLEKGLISLRQPLPEPDVWGIQPAPDTWGYATWVYSWFVNSCLQQLLMVEPS